MEKASFTNKHLLAPISLQSVRYYELWSILDKFSFNYECGKEFDWSQLKNMFFEKDDIQRLPITLSYFCDKKHVIDASDYRSYFKITCLKCNFCVSFKAEHQKKQYNQNRYCVDMSSSNYYHHCVNNDKCIMIPKKYNWLLIEHPLFIRIFKEQYYQHNQEKTFYRGNICSLMKNHGFDFETDISQSSFSRIFRKIKVRYALETLNSYHRLSSFISHYHHSFNTSTLALQKDSVGRFYRLFVAIPNAGKFMFVS